MFEVGKSVETEGRYVVVGARSEGGKWGMTADGMGLGIFWIVENTLKSDCGAGCTVLEIY